MHGRRLALTALLAALALPAAAYAAPSGPVAQACAPAGSAAVALCYGADVVTRDGQAYATPDRYKNAIAAYQRSWTHTALLLQSELGNDVGFANAPWIGTHNSFNSIAEEGPSLSDTDSNQQLKLTDQLQLDMRTLEIDVHWFPSPRSGGYAPVVCHAGAVSEHDGCTTERLLGSILAELRAWLDKHPRQVLLLYVEDHIDRGYEQAAHAFLSQLGPYLYRTHTSGSCVKLPMTLTRDDVLAAGKQVVVVSGCGPAGAINWRSVAFDWSSHVEERPHGYQDYPNCGPDYSRATYDSKLVRYYEDSTWLTTSTAQLGQSTVDDGITQQTAAAMERCGVDMINFDQLVPGDGRLTSLVWSWKPGEPESYADCVGASENSGGFHWYTSACTANALPACRTTSGGWIVPQVLVTEADAAAACANAGAVFDVPRTGYENELLRAAANGSPVWLGYVRGSSGFQPVNPR